MARSFGIDTNTSPSAVWADLKRGPSRNEVLRHLAKLARYARHPA